MLSRREFIRVIFETVPAAAFIGTWPTSAGASPEQPQWPDEKRDLPKHDPVIMALDESGYLIDPDFDYGAVEMPTFKENFHVEEMTDDERLNFYLDWHNEDAYDLLVDKLGVDEIDEYTVDHLPILDENYADWLNEPIDPELLGPYQLKGYSEYWMGIELLEQLGDGIGAELGLGLVQGDHPGSSFTGVRFDGDPDVLNTQLYQRGINLKLVRESPRKDIFDYINHTWPLAWQKHHATDVIVESSGAGRSLVQQLQEEMKFLGHRPFTLSWSNPSQDKATRLMSQSPEIEAGRVYLPADADWLDVFRGELLDFPNGVNDDQVDSLNGKLK